MALDPIRLALLALSGLVGGVGITAVGPGGVLPTIGMFLLTGLSPAGVAGTAITTHIATGALGTAAYTRSGQLRDPATRRVAVILAGAAVAGVPLGVLFNSMVSGRGFAILIAVAVAVTGVLVWARERRTGHRAPPGNNGPGPGPEARSGRPATIGNGGPVRLPAAAVGAVGLVVAVVAGLFGLGGPMLSVPLLVICGLPVLPALAAAQAQSVVIASIGTAAYLAHGSVDWPLAAVVGVPELAGVLIGWKIAHAVPARQLTCALAGVLLALAPYLALHS